MIASAVLVSIFYVVLAALPGGVGTGADASCKAGAQIYATTLGNCAYGQPIVDGDLVLVPKVCHHDLAGRKVVRRSVEVKSLATGQRVQQASLPPEDFTGTTLPVVGQLWPGAPVLLAYPGGIAAIESRAGKADVVMEPQGPLLAVARSGDLLAIVEQLPAEGKEAPMLEWTVLDLAAGEILGLTHMKPSPVADLRWSLDPRGLAVELDVPHGDKLLTLRVPVRDSGGKSLISKEILVPVATAATAKDRYLPGDPESVLSREALRVESTGDVRGSRLAACQLAAPSKCLAKLAPNRGDHWLAWLQPPTGPRELRACPVAP